MTDAEMLFRVKNNQMSHHGKGNCVSESPVLQSSPVALPSSLVAVTTCSTLHEDEEDSVGVKNKEAI